MQHAYIFGNGPSLFFEVPGVKNALNLFTNRLIFSAPDIGPKRMYVCGDVRFALSAEWKRSVGSFAGEIWLGAELAAASELSGQYFLAPDSFTSNDSREYFEQLSITTFPLMNVVLDYAIPVAIESGATSLHLVGCDFSYGSNMDKPNYWPGYQARGASFDHSSATADAWRIGSQERFNAVAQWLFERDIFIERVQAPKS